MRQRQYIWTPKDAIIPPSYGDSIPYNGMVPLLTYIYDHALNWILIMEIL